MTPVFQLRKLRGNMMMQRIMGRGRIGTQLFWLILCSSESPDTPVGEATLAPRSRESVSGCRAFGSSVFTLHLEKGEQSPQTGKPGARMSTSPKRHSTVLFEGKTGKNWATQDLKDLVSVYLQRGVFIMVWTVVWRQPISSGGSRGDLNKVLPDWKFSNQWSRDEGLPLQWTGRAWRAHKIFCLTMVCLTRRNQEALLGGAGDWDTVG